jgi:hypothetical protein
MEEITRMKRMKAFAIASCLGLLMVAVPTLADQWNKRTILTVNEPISVPSPGSKEGKVLQPGKYVMKLMDSPSNRHIVQIFNEDESQLVTTILAIPNYRMQPTGDTHFGFWETPAGQPRALRSWFYPGDNFGQEFVYSPAQAQAIAATTHERVPVTAAQTESDLATARVATVDQAGTEYELDRQTYNPPQTAQAEQPRQEAEQPRQEDTMVAQRTPQQEPMREATPAPTYNEADRELPATGSPLPLVGLAGLLSLGAAAVTRIAAKRL